MADVLYVVADKLGGIASFTSNLIRYRPPSDLRQRVILFRSDDEIDAPITEPLGADEQNRFRYSSNDNTYSRLRRMRNLIGAGQGALVSNDGLDLETFSVFSPGRTIFQVVHDEYNFRLATVYEPIIDVMIAHSRFYFDKLVRHFPARSSQIFYLPYGIRLSSVVRKPKKGPLHLVFLGRLHVGKGVHDLPNIDRLLIEAKIDVIWTIIGNGPESDRLQSEWPPTDRVRYAHPVTNDEVLSKCAEGDVFVLPTRFEGFPVALLEAMSAGLVPVVSDLPSGIPEVVTEDSGFRLPVGNCAGFAEAVERLSQDREMLERMSVAARKQAERFDIRDRVGAYHGLFGSWEEFRRPWSGPLKMNHGSRLDQRWMPNAVTRLARLMISARGTARLPYR